MNFAFSEEQEELRNIVRSFLDNKSSEATVRELMETENGFDDRGSRPVANAPDVIWAIRQGAFYGWPDYVAGEPITVGPLHPAAASTERSRREADDRVRHLEAAHQPSRRTRILPVQRRHQLQEQCHVGALRT